MATPQQRAKAIVDAFTNEDTVTAKFRRIIEDYYVGKGQPSTILGVPTTYAEQCLFFVKD